MTPIVPRETVTGAQLTATGQAFAALSAMVDASSDFGMPYEHPARAKAREAFDAVERAQPLPSTAAPQPEQASINTWEERYNAMPGGLSDLDVRKCMEAEIADLRAALAIPASTAPQPEHETIVREGDRIVCTACGTTAASEQAKVDAHTTSYGQGYRAGIEIGQAMAADAASEQPASVSDERPSPPVLSDERRAEAMERYGTGVLPWSCRIPPNQSARVIADAMQDELNELRPLVKSARAALSGRATTPGEADVVSRGTIPDSIAQISLDLDHGG